MRVIVIDPPAPVVTWAEAEKHLKLDGDTEQQTEVEGMIAAATAHIDVESWLGRAIGVQTLEARLDRFDPCGMNLPYRPVIDMLSIKYVDVNGIEQTLDNTAYELIGSEVITAWSISWPTPRNQREAVRIRYRAGYEVLPKAIRSAILLMVGDLYRNRDTTVAGVGGSTEIQMSTTVANLLRPFQVLA